jgi:hypothetical protein
MRAPTLFLLTFSLISPAMAQLQPLNPPGSTAPAAAGQPGTRKLTPDGKIQIGYDKRADYRLIKQPTGEPATSTPATSAANTPTAPTNPNPNQNLDGNIFNPQSAPQPAPTPAVAAAPAAPAAAKPRSDSALRSDSSPARDAAAAAQAAAASKAAEEKKKADELAAAIAAAQKAGALPLKPQ